MNKQEIRQVLKQTRRALSSEIVQENSLAVCRRVLSLPAWQTSARVLLYRACQNEIDTAPLFEEAEKCGKTVLLPVTVPEKNEMYASPLSADSTLAPGAYGILEPIHPQKSTDSPELVIVPGIAFDRHGGRIGFGKGYYDHFLANQNAVTVALCHGFQLVPDCFSEAFDHPMDYIVTEKEVIVCEKRT